MKKQLLYLFLLIPVMVFSQITGQLNINRDQFTFNKEEEYHRISYGNNYINEVGMPELPVVYRSYVVPLGASDFQLQVQSDKEEPFDGFYLIFPVQPPQFNSFKNESEFVQPDSVIYNSLNPFPSEQANIVSDNIIQGYRIITIALYPLEYIPVERSLSIRQMSYTIHYSMTISSVQFPPISVRRSELAKTYVKSIVNNPQEVDNYTDQSKILPEIPDLDRFKVNPKQRSLNVMDWVVPDFVIITNNEMKDAFQRLADWKTKKGIPTVISTIEEIQRDYQGADSVEKIRNYLFEVKKRWNENSLSILLGGDSNIIPTRMIKSEEPGSVSLQCTDACYSSNNFIWNASDNTCNRNIVISSYLGRIPVRNRTEANSFINKIINYEKSPQQGIDYSYYNNFLFSSSYMSQNSKGPNDGYMDIFDRWRRDYILSPSNYWYIFDHFGCQKNDHEVHNYDTKQGEELNRKNFLSILENGRGIGQIHFIMHDDHAITSAFGISTKDKAEAITNNDVDIMADNPYYNIIMSTSCHPADFAKDCVAEHFLRKNGGTVAFFGNTDVGWRDERYQIENALKTLFNNNQTSAGQYDLGYLQIQALVLTENYNTNYRLHLLGDPTMPVWTATPKNLNVIIASEVNFSGPTKINVQITNLPAGTLASVCLMKGKEGYATLTVKDTEIHSFTFTPRTAGNLDITVTAHNFRPFEKTISFAPAVKSLLKILNKTLIDSRTQGCDGNGNGYADAGETAEMTVNLKNTGYTAALNVRGTVYSNSRYISILSDSIFFGNIPANFTIPSYNRIRFKIDPDAPETLQNDFDATCFFLDLMDSEGNFYSDTLQLDIFEPKLELREQVTSGLIIPGAQNGLFVNLMNTGKSNILRLEAKLEPETGLTYVENCPVNLTSYSNIDVGVTSKNLTELRFKIKSTFLKNYPLKMKLTVTNEYGKTWTFHIDPNDRCLPVNSQNISFRPQENSIELFWPSNSNDIGYNIYRSESENGNYVKQNIVPLLAAYYRDEKVNRPNNYYYKVSVISRSGNQSSLSGSVKAWMSLQSIGLFPRFTCESKKIEGSVNVVDVDYDGKKEIFLTERLWNKAGDGYLLGIRHNGEELFDIDGNVTSFSGFAKLSTTALATPAIGDLKGNGEQNIVATTWKNTDLAEPRNSIECFASRDANGDGLPDKVWQFDMGDIMSFQGIVLSNLDNSPDGTLEVLHRNINDSSLRIIDCNGNLQSTINIGANAGVLAVADLDNDGDKEILAVHEQSLYIWHHNGTPFKSNPFFTCDYKLSSPVVCDLDNDGQKEILVATKQTLESKIYAVKINGTCLSGWNGTVTIPYCQNSLDHMLSVGDINRDGKLEVVALGLNIVKAWRNDGSEIFARQINNIFLDIKWAHCYSVPILADVDGIADDYMPDIVFGTEKGVYALHNDGTDVVGFPLQTDDRINGSVCVTDMDNDGKNELIVADMGYTYAWKTNGSPDAIEWGSERSNPQNTGEYGKICEPLLILSNQIWNGAPPCGNVIVQKGTLTILSGKTLTLTDKTSKVIVRPGASLVVDGGIISNAYVLVLSGGSLTLKNGGTIKLRNAAKVKIEKGGLFSNLNGKID